MKQIFTLIILISLCLYSCNNEVVYSCNENINEWVHENLSNIRIMSRSEWNNLEEDVKVPVYRAFTHQQRVAFWKNRFSDILALEWSKEEKAHIGLLLEFIDNNQYIFEGYDIMSDKEKNIFDLFFHEWRDKAKVDFGWSNSLLYSILASGNTMVDTSGTLLMTNNKANSRSLEPNSSCNCSTSSDWCDFTSINNCEKVTCETSANGCGTVWVYSCDGRCGGI